LIFYYHDDGPLLHLGFYCGCEENTTDDGKNVEIENDVEGCDPAAIRKSLFQSSSRWRSKAERNEMENALWFTKCEGRGQVVA
jgi:hypothetical protein